MAGVPVVGARMGGIADLIRHGDNGFLYDAASSRALESALRDLIAHPDWVVEFSRRLPQVKSIAADAAEWDAAYAEVLGRRVPVGAVE